MATRRTFSGEFKHEAVRLVKERGVAITQAARDLKNKVPGTIQVLPLPPLNCP